MRFFYVWSGCFVFLIGCDQQPPACASPDGCGQPLPACTDLYCSKWPVGFDWQTHREVALSLAVSDSNGGRLPGTRVEVYAAYDPSLGGTQLLFSGQTNNSGVLELNHRVPKSRSVVWVKVLDGRADPWFTVSVAEGNDVAVAEVLR